MCPYLIKILDGPRIKVPFMEEPPVTVTLVKDWIAED